MQTPPSTTPSRASCRQSSPPSSRTPPSPTSSSFAAAVVQDFPRASLTRAPSRRVGHRRRDHPRQRSHLRVCLQWRVGFRTVLRLRLPVSGDAAALQQSLQPTWIANDPDDGRAASAPDDVEPEAPAGSSNQLAARVKHGEQAREGEVRAQPIVAVVASYRTKRRASEASRRDRGSSRRCGNLFQRNRRGNRWQTRSRVARRANAAANSSKSKVTTRTRPQLRHRRRIRLMRPPRRTFARSLALRR